MLIGIICLIFSIACLIYSLFAFQQKGPLLSTMYFISNTEERSRMKTKKKYEFIATTFLLISILLGLMSIGAMFAITWVSILTIAIGILTVVYAFVVSIKYSLQK
ncbi:MAG: hypothetical protein ACRCYC_14175 [Paraclostridium sp.]|uniref:hypothetical protein n=1 Tax=Paraclostridium sp. TaxID=2023273 RepID=UPI003F3C75F8